MKIPTTIIAALLSVLPATALAQPHDSGGYHPAPEHFTQASHYSQSAHYSETSHYTTQRYAQQPPRYEQRPVQPMPHYVNRYTSPNVRENYNVGVRYNPGVHFYNGYGRPAWYWHGGVAWVGAPSFWGGGFWGDFAIGLPVTSYSVQEDSPGAQLLANYQLQQGPCDQDNMVSIFGPDGSQICAYPNDMVGPGQYQIDMSNLTLVSG